MGATERGAETLSRLSILSCESNVYESEISSWRRPANGDAAERNMAKLGDGGGVNGVTM